MATLKAPRGCNEVVHGADVYRVMNGVVTVPDHVAHELLTKGAHGFAAVSIEQQQEPRKIVAMKK